MENFVVLDIETTGLDPFSDKIIGFGLADEKKILVRVSMDEKVLLRDIWENISNKIVIGYNVKNFDFHFLKIRSLKNDIAVKKVSNVVDLLEILGMNNSYKRKSLNFLLEFLDFNTKPFSGAKIPEFLERGEIKKIEMYIEEEIKALLKLIKKLKDCGLLNL